MPIRWDPKEVTTALEKIEACLAQARPFLEQAGREGQRATGIRNLPGYMGEPLGRLQEHVKDLRSRCQRDIDSLRERMPAATVARSKKQQGKGLFDS